MAEILLFMCVRLFLPLILISASLMRPGGVSLLYLMMFYLSPWLLQTKSEVQRIMLKIYLLLLCCLSSIAFLMHILVNAISLIFLNVHACDENGVGYMLQHVGFTNFKGWRLSCILHWMLPDIIIFVGSLIVYFATNFASKQINQPKKDSEGQRQYETHSDMNRILIIVYIRSVIKTSPVFSLIVLYFAATLRPSLPGSLYFLLVIVAGTYWSLYRPLHIGVHYPLIIMVIALILHITCIFIYQLPIMERIIARNALLARIMGMEVLFSVTCHIKTTMLEMNKSLNIDSFMSPVALMLAYFVVTLNLIHRARYEITFNALRLAMHGNKNNDTPENSSRPMTPDLERGRTSLSLKPLSMLEQFFYMLYDITAFIYKNSYILLNILMMIWSIVYHSWLAFVLLIWANILWMIPNQRRSMMRSSFPVVLYCEFLVLAGYVYGMDLNENELPTKGGGINVEQIGFHRPQNHDEMPFISLTVKTSFLVIFWITSRQYFKEKTSTDLVQSDLLRQIFGPHISRSDNNVYDKTPVQRLVLYFMETITNFVTRIWMWLLIFLIFLCAMIDRYMTGFRICYMSLLLLFLMVFQMSLTLWIKFLYGYWIFLIFYAMSILTVIYTYQFDEFDYYWEKYLGINPTLQYDIGLSRYKTKDLFLHLLIPTLTVIFTVVQLHYFHRKLMKSMRYPKPIRLPSVTIAHHSMIHAPRSTITYESHTRTWRMLFTGTYKKIRGKIRRWFSPCKEVIWRFLQMHGIKAVILAAFMCCISDICFFNLFLATLVVISVNLNRILGRCIYRIFSFWVSVMVLMKMIYQIKYMNPAIYEFDCNNKTVNFAHWVGVHKCEMSWSALLRYISPYMIYIIIASLYAVVKLREHLMSYTTGGSEAQKVIFPETERLDAERDFISLIKYLLNYGYFKFGLEISLIALVSTITQRRDMLAIAYIVWLIIMLCLSRVQCARIWGLLQAFLMISILIQYLYLLNFPPNVCILIDFDTPQTMYEDTLWCWLPREVQKHITAELVTDFIALVLISRQRKAFKIEMRHLDNDNYPGGNNKSVVYQTSKLGQVYFDNPTHDFCSYVRNYSDVLKTAIFCSFFWITLAVVFMAGVCSMDMLSLGYLIFGLVFLLQGSEVYLTNIHSLIRRWNCLIAFNVLNIAIKVCVIALNATMKINNVIMVQYLIGFVHNARVDTTTIVPKNHYGPHSLLFTNTIVWHAIVFAFVIFQKRIFCSYYFCHMIIDTQANTILASRGAAIIENLHYKQIYDRRQYEKTVLENLKVKMERIRASNRKNYRRGRSFNLRVQSPVVTDTQDSPTDNSDLSIYSGQITDLTTKDTVTQDQDQVKRQDQEQVKDKDQDQVVGKHPDSDAKFYTKPSGAHVQIADDVLISPDLSIRSEKRPIHQELITEAYFARSPQPKRRDLRLHPHVVRAGDYYMFEEIDDADEADTYEEYDFLAKEELRARQIMSLQHFAKMEAQTKTNIRGSSTSIEIKSFEYETDESDNEDFDTHPVVKLTVELIILITFRLNRLSRNYRFVHKVLSAEKKTLQEISAMNRLGLSNTAAMFNVLNQSLYIQKNREGTARESIFSLATKGDDFTLLDHNNFVKMCIAFWYAVIANTEVIVYLTVFINQAANSSIISLPLPLLVLFWGALTLPRPTKTFWVTLITYTLAMIVVKMLIVLFQNMIKTVSFDYELVMKHGNAVYDLLLVVVLFWHRYMLKKQGIWNVQKPYMQLAPLDKSPTRITRSYNPNRPEDILERLRQEGGNTDPNANANAEAVENSNNELDRDINDVLRPGMQNIYVYRNIESDYYRKSMQRLENKGGFFSGVHKFFLALHDKARLSTDVYTLLFVCDFINFFVLLFGFPKFAYRYKYSTSVIHSYIQENRVPFSFLIMLIVQFLTIVTERAIYLRKALAYKIVFYFISIIGTHIWMFFLVPYVTGHSFGATAPVMFYLIKCLHMLLSAYQIRCGYPRRILGNVFTKSYSLVNMVAFKIYMEIPFLYILRTMLDWVCIDTTLTLMEWIKMEDIFQSVFIVRCYRQMDTDFPVLRGEPKVLYMKLLVGGTIILLLILLIWSPLFLFALVGTVGKPNVPRKADITVQIAHYEPIYVSQSYSGIHQFSELEFDTLASRFITDNYAYDHIMVYDAVDISAIKFDPNSVTVWNMSPPDKKRLLEELNAGKMMEIRITLSMDRGLSPEKIQHEAKYTLTQNKEKTREMLYQLLAGTDKGLKVIVPNILPKFISVQNNQMNVEFLKDFGGKYSRSITLQKKEAESKTWWEMHDFCEDDFYKTVLSDLPLSDCDGGVVIYTFNDKSFPATMNFLAKAGIIGLYTTFVFLVSRIIRTLIANNHRRIMFEDLPYVDRVLKLCYDIYLVRETQEYRLEEDLYAKLIFLYRSPETLIKWTRFKEDLPDDYSISTISSARSQLGSRDPSLLSLRSYQRRPQTPSSTPPQPTTTPQTPSQQPPPPPPPRPQ